MIQLADNKHCTGCSACMNVCPHKAISMQPDVEGFLQPVIDDEKCVECHLCEKRCPAINPLRTDGNTPKAYAVINKKDRNVSSSGGAFSLFARMVLNDGGVVVGAAYDDKLRTRHISISDINDLDKLRGSKYVQSEIGDSYSQVKSYLNDGRKVLFCGTPCQVAGLYKFLNKRYDGQLITLDLVCHGVPSPLVFEKYLEKLKKIDRPKGGNIKGFRFRKLDSWAIIPAVKFSESKWRILEQERNAYMSAFFKGWTYRECCFNCQYANMNRVGTYTIADFWGIGKHGMPFKKNVASGVSLVIDNCGNFKETISTMINDVYVEERPLEEALYENHNLKAPVKREKERDTAISDMIDNDFSLLDFAKKYGLLKKETLKLRMKKHVKNAIYALGLYNVYKSITYRLK